MPAEILIINMKDECGFEAPGVSGELFGNFSTHYPTM